MDAEVERRNLIEEIRNSILNKLPDIKVPYYTFHDKNAVTLWRKEETKEILRTSEAKLLDVLNYRKWASVDDIVYFVQAHPELPFLKSFPFGVMDHRFKKQFFIYNEEMI